LLQKYSHLVGTLYTTTIREVLMRMVDGGGGGGGVGGGGDGG